MRSQPRVCPFATGLCAVFVLTLCVSSPGLADPAAAAAEPELSAALEAALPGLIEEAGVPGLSIALLREGRPVWHGAFGVKSTESGEPVTVDTVFEAASLSKPVFAYAVLRLAERRGFDVDAPLWRTLPYDRLAHDERVRAIDARLALSHRTGLPNWGGARLELAFDPGTSWSYSGEGYVFVQKAVEKATGLDLAAFVRREVLEPLGMAASSFVWRGAYETSAADPHGRLGKAEPRRKREEGNAASSLLTTAPDYARFVASVLRDAKAGRRLAARMLEPQAEVRKWGTSEVVPHLYWGLGWGLQDGAAGRAFWHWGDNGSFRCYVIAYPETGDGLVFFTNSENGLSLADTLLSRVFPGDEHRGLEFADYEPYDAPGRRMALRLERVFLDEGGAAGLALYGRLAEKQPDVLDASLAERVARTLMRQDRAGDAIALLEANVERFPDLVPALHGVAQATLDAGRLEKALELYRRILKLAPDDERAPVRVAWAESGLAAREKPVELEAGALRRFAGSYGPRQVTFADGRLLYVRRGRDVEYRLSPLTEDTFALEGQPTFRLRFVSDEGGRVVKVEGLYSNGDKDESPRDP